MREAAGLFRLPYSTLKDRVHAHQRQEALGVVVYKAVGHPTVFSLEEEKDLVSRLKYLAARGFGCTPEQIRRAAFVYATTKKINHPWSTQSKSAGRDWFTGFMRRNNELSLRKPEGLSKARAEGLNRKAVADFFLLYQNLTTKLNINAKPHLVFNMDESGLPLNNAPAKIVATKGAREVVKLTSVERGENVTLVACCSASGVFIPPFVIFKGVRFREMYKQDLPPGSEVAMSDSGYINENIFLEWLQHFQKHRAQGKCLLVLDGHGSHSSLSSLDYCQENGIEMMCLSPHTTHVLQPLDRTVFKPIKSFYHQEATNYMHSNPTGAINKSNFGKLLSRAWSKGATVGNAVKGFECTGIFPFNPLVIPEDKFLPSQHFQPETPEHASTSASIQPTPKTSPFSTIIPSPEKKESRKRRRTQVTKHLTSDSNIQESRVKSKLKMEKENKEKRRSTVKRNCGNSESNDGLVPVQIDCSDEEDAPCGFCGIKFYSPKSASKGDWIKCQKCGLWFHEVCVGAVCKKNFICGKCI